MKKNIKFIFLLVISLLLLTGCFGEHIEDLNGEDNYNLSTLNESHLIEGTNSSLVIGSVTSNINNKFKQKVKKFSGVTKIYELDSNSTYEIEFIVTLGNGLAGVVSDNGIEWIIKPNTKITVNVPKNSDYIVKIVGESCQFEVIINKK